MDKNDGRVLVIGESGSDDETPSRIKIDATNLRNSGRLQCKNNAKFSDCFTGSRKSFIIKGRGSSVVEQPIRNYLLAPLYSLSINVDDVIVSATVGLTLRASLHLSLH